jgi:heme-degrading monooxygenase HmoA
MGCEALAVSQETHVTVYAYIWEFEVRPGREAEFEGYYGPAGSWVRLFRTAHGYLGTVLLRDRTNLHRYLTVDRWESEAAYRAFRQAQATAFAGLDSQCEAVTVAEREAGHFDVIGDPAA